MAPACSFPLEKRQSYSSWILLPIEPRRNLLCTLELPVVLIGLICSHMTSWDAPRAKELNLKTMDLKFIYMASHSSLPLEGRQPARFPMTIELMRQIILDDPRAKELNLKTMAF
jgi:hypothetical protein